ncbi:MAG: alpha/beta fold hydrolase, partial [bacterium]
MTAVVPAHIAVNGVRYAVRSWGSESPLVLQHGFTGSSALWTVHAKAWAAHWRVVAIDLLGHGASEVAIDAARYAMAPTVADVAGLLDALGIERCALLGYSLGGRVALAFALEQPRRVAALILESASPGVAAADERAARAAADEQLAARLERDGISAFVEGWMAQPLFATQARLAASRRAAARAQRLANSAAGLAASLRGLGTGA